MSSFPILPFEVQKEMIKGSLSLDLSEYLGIDSVAAEDLVLSIEKLIDAKIRVALRDAEVVDGTIYDGS